VAGIDLVACNVQVANVLVITADIANPAALEAATAFLGGPADLVTSDLAPKLTGVKDQDQARMTALIGAASDLARTVLRPGGAMITKIFMGSEFSEIVAGFKKHYSKVEVVHVQASRPGSAELYLVARGMRAGSRIAAAPSTEPDGAPEA
jgi:23S rRNA (uridine2552-2'-O)-methyltransferase